MSVDDLPMVAVVDIDGVVADVRHRLHHVAGRPKDWRSFFAAAADDGLLAEGEHTVRALAEVYDVVYLSGRPERLRRVTQDWFARHDLPEGELLLRPFDDDPRVLDAARAAGFDVLPATWMGEHTALREAQERDGRT